MDDSNIEVVLTDESELYCFKLVFHVWHGLNREPIEINLHTRQAFDLFHKLGERLMDYFARESKELLRQKMEQLKGQLNANREREAQGQRENG